MAIAKRAPQIETDQGTVYIFEDERLFDAMVAATARTLDQLDDDALLAQRQVRLVARVKRAVCEELQREMPERLAARSPWHFSRALGTYLLREVRKRQFAAFERRLTEQYGPVGPMTPEEYEERSAIINGVRVIRVDPPADETATGTDA